MNHCVRIEKMIAGGLGLARTEAGQAIMSGLVLPGETVELREIAKKSGYIEAELVRLLLPSLERIRPDCPHWGRCGGCDLQHASTTEQLRIKQAIVAESATRAGLALPAAGIRATVPSPQQWGYRHRLRLKVGPNGQLGFFRKRSHDFLAVERCPTAAAELNAALAQLVASDCLRELAGQGTEAELQLSPADRRVGVVLLTKGKSRIPAGTVRALAASDCIDFVGQTTEDGFRQLHSRSGQAATLAQHVLLPGLPGGCCVLFWSGGCFSQVNPGQNEQLIRLVLELAGSVQGKTVLDLYCGMGNFSIPLAMAGGMVEGVEGGQESIRWAGRNAKAAGVWASFVADDVRSRLKLLARDRRRADVVLLDPPRTGIGSAVELLPQLHPERIVHVSCDPATLARDLAVLCARGYRLAELVPVDMFPQTSHVESVALLEKI